MYSALLLTALAVAQPPAPQTAVVQGPGRAYLVVVYPFEAPPGPVRRSPAAQYQLDDPPEPDDLDLCLRARDGRTRFLDLRLQFGLRRDRVSGYDSGAPPVSGYGYEPRYGPLGSGYGYEPRYGPLGSGYGYEPRYAPLGSGRELDAQIGARIGAGRWR